MTLCEVVEYRDVPVRARVPLMWARTILLHVRRGPLQAVVELELVIASPGHWRRLVSADVDGDWWTQKFGPFVVGLRPARGVPSTP